MKPKSSLLPFLALVGSSLLTVSSASAATVNWEGDTSNLWATAGNWDTAPANNLTADIANFNLATYGGNPVFAPTVGTATSINGITIGASNGTMTLTNTAALSIGASGIAIANGAGAFTISGSTTLGASQSWTNNSSNLFTFGAVTNGANTLTIGGTGNTIASGVISNGAGGLTKEGAGILTLNAANLYTGATTVNGGELRWGVANAIAGGALNINDGGTVNIQGFSDTVGTITIAQGGSITGTTGVFTTSSLISNNGGTMTGATLVLANNAGVTYNSTGPGSTTFQIEKLTLNDSGTNVFNIAKGDAAVDFDITGTVNNGGNNVSRTITKTGAGVMQFSGSTVGTAGQNGVFLNINEGTVLMNRGTGVSFAPGSAFGITVGDSTGTAGSAILKFAATGGDNQIGNRSITINSDGLYDLNGKTQSGTGTVALNGTGQMDFNGGSLSVGAVTIVGTGAGANTTPIKNTAGNGGLTVASLAITPDAGYTSTVSLGASGTLTLGGDVTFNAAGTGRAQITGSALSLGAANRTFNIGLGSGADYDLLVGAGISGATRSLTKNGMGRMVLTGSNSYTGGTTVNAGTLQIGDGTTAGTMASTGALTMGGGTFRVLAPASGGSSQTVGSLATTASTGSTIRLTPGASGNTTLTITGTGLSTGAGSSLNFDYTAGTTVGGTVGNNYVVWNPTLTGGIIGGAYTVTDSGGTGFATKNGTNIVRLTDPGGAGLPVSGGGATGSYFVNSSYSTDSTTTPGSLVQALSGAVAASNVTVNTTGLASGANLALGTNLLTLGAGIVFDGPNAYEITGSGAGGLRAASAGGTINLYNANTNTVTISAPIANNSASRLTIDGPGTMILSGTNTYTGATVLNGGVTRFSGTMAGSALTLNNGAVAQLGTATGLTSSNTVTFGAGATGSLQLRGNNLTIGALNSNTTTLGTPVITNNNAANATLTINSGSASTFGGVIQDGAGGGTLALTNSGSGTLTLSGINTYSGGTTINAGAVSITSDANLGNPTGGITLNGGRLTINGVVINTARDITVTGSGSSMVANKNQSFTSSGTLTGSGAITFVDPGGSGTTPFYNFSSSANTFTGSMTLNAADVRVSSLGDATGNNLAFITASGSTFSLNSTGVTSGLTFNNRAIELSNVSGTVSNNNATHAITIGSNLVATGAGAKVLTLGAVAGPTNVFSGSITNGTGGGTVGLTKSGAGTWVIGNSANTYTGTTTLGGTLIIDTLSNYNFASSLGAPTSGDIIFDKNQTSTLIYEGDGDTTNRTIRHEADVSNRNNSSGIYNNGTGALIFNGSTFNTPFVASGNGGRTTTFNLGGSYTGEANEIRGVIANNDATSLIAITKVGSGTWTLTGDNTYTGGTTVSGGTLKISGGGSVYGSAYNNSAVVTVQSGGVLELDNWLYQANEGLGQLDKGAARIVINNGTIRMNGTTEYGRGVTVQSGGATFEAASGANWTHGGFDLTENVYTSNPSLTFTGAGNGTFGKLFTGSGSLTKSGAGTWTFTRLNTYTGATSISAGTLSAGNIVVSGGSSNLGNATSAVTLGSAGSQGTLSYTGNSATYTRGFTIGGAGGGRLDVTTSGQTLTVGSGAVTGSGLFTVGGAGNTTISANLTHTGGLTKTGAGTLTISGSGNTYTGGTTVSAGTMALGASNVLPNSGAVDVSGGVLSIGGNSDTVGAVTLTSGSITGTGGTLTGSSYAVQSGSVSAILGGTGSLTKSTSGTVTLTGANAYSGATNVNEGMLHVSGSGSINGSSGITVNGGHFKYNSSTNLTAPLTFTSGTVSGTNLAGVSLTVGTGDTVSPGNSPGTMNVANQTWAAGGTYLWELYDATGVAGTGWDLLAGTGTLDITASLGSEFIIDLTTLAAVAPDVLGDAINFNASNSYAWLIADFASVTGFNTTDFTIDATGFTNAPLGGSFGISLGGVGAVPGDSSQVYLIYNAIPEPGAALLGGLGTLLLLRRRRQG